jgi:hypothetical protein
MVSGMAGPEESLLFAAAALAGGIATVSGFGIGSLLTPLLMLSSPTADAVAVVAIPHAVATTIRWVRLRGQVHGPTFRQFGLTSAIGGVAGALLLRRLASPVLTIILASLLTLAGATELTGRRVSWPRTPLWRAAGWSATRVAFAPRPCSDSICAHGSWSPPRRRRRYSSTLPGCPYIWRAQLTCCPPTSHESPGCPSA